MRRITFLLVAGLAVAAYALPQESGGAAKNGEASQSDSMIWWEWANFVILAGGLGYLIRKHVPPLFRKQSDEIQAALAEAAKIKHEAGVYAASVEARLADLQREIENLRQDAHAEMAAESDRIRRETERHLQRLREQSVQEVALMTRGAKDELRKYAAQLAVGLAGDRIRSRMTSGVQEKLVNRFLSDLNHRTAN
jgi:F-type H+-transporting ATPase subunit b